MARQRNPDEQAAEMLDAQSGVSKSTKMKANPKDAQWHSTALQLNTGKSKWQDGLGGGYEDTGGASRFFYTAKASKAERNAGLERCEQNMHPTVKPVSLMTYLVKLVSMPKGTRILDPFAGEGATLIACKKLGIDCVGVDLDEDDENCKTADGRLSYRVGVSKRKKLRLSRKRSKKGR